MDVKRAAVYGRYSSEEQTGGESIEYQLERCREYVAERSWSLDESNVFVDRARSGTSTYRREEFNRMVGLAKSKDRPFDVVVAWSTSRFGRNQDEAIFNKIGLRRQGVDVKFVSQPVPDGHIGTLIERIYEWKDEFDSIQIGKYAFQGQKQVTLKGYHGGGKAPYGYRRVRVPDPDGKQDKDGKVVEYVTYEVVEDQAEVVRRVFRMYAEGFSYKNVAHALNAEGIRSPGGSTWDISSVRTVLLNENYRGHRVWNQTRRNKKAQRGTKLPKPRDEWVITENAHPAIVEQELWDLVAKRRKQLSRHIRNGGGNRTVHSPYLLTGLLKCSECGGNFIMSSRRRNGRTDGRYRCSYHSNRGSSVCANNRLVGQRLLENAVLDTVADELLSEDVIKRVLEECHKHAKKTKPDDDRLRGIRDAVSQADREIHNLTQGIAIGGPIEELVDRLKVCKSRKMVLEGQLKSAREAREAPLANVAWEDVEQAIGNLHETLEYATMEEKRSLLRENISEVSIPKNGNALLDANPAGLFKTAGVLLNGDPEGSRVPDS